MRKRRVIYSIVVVLIVGSAFVMIGYHWRCSKLEAERIFIESEYKGLLSLIEEKANDPAIELDSNGQVENLEKHNAVYDEIARALSPDLVYWAMWSRDGHHGLHGLNRHEERNGFTTLPLPVSANSNGLRSLRIGRSVDGDALLVFESRVPQGLRQVYTIAFYQKVIRDGLRSARN